MGIQNETTLVSSKKNWRTNHKFLFKLLFISLTLNVLTVMLFVGKRFYFSNYYLFHDKAKAAYNIENDSNYIKGREARTELIQMLPNEKDEIIFVGNSITEAFPLQEIFHNISIKNRGVSGNTSKDILKRLPTIVDPKPKKIFLQVGINDIGRGINMDTLFSSFQKITSIIKQKTPNTILYVQSVFPTALGQKELVPKIVLYNKRIEEYCQRQNIVFIDLYPFFLKDNALDTSFTYDGVHLKAKGYFLWKQLLEKYVTD